MSDLSTRRLLKEYKTLKKDPVKLIRTKPLETNILEWHYVIEGTPDSYYAGGFYHGKLVFPPEYPLKPPSILMFTPSGRFKINHRLCLNVSDYHPESWNPMWSVSTILTGLHTFMLDTSPTFGSVNSTPEEKRRYAKLSLGFNCRDKVTGPHFRALFPELAAQQEENEKKALEDVDGALCGGSSDITPNGSVDAGGKTHFEPQLLASSMVYLTLAVMGGLVLAFSVLIAWW